MPDEDIAESKVNAQTLPSTKKPTEETLQAPHESSALQLPDVAQPDLQPASPGVPPSVSTRSGRMVRRPTYLRDFTILESSTGLSKPFWTVNTVRLVFLC